MAADSYGEDQPRVLTTHGALMDSRALVTLDDYGITNKTIIVFCSDNGFVSRAGKGSAAAETHHVKIHDAKRHYHAHTDEFYYVIDGQGTMTLDGTEIELHQGVVFYVPRGIKHKAVGNLTVLTVCIPRGVFNDIHELE